MSHHGTHHTITHDETVVHHTSTHADTVVDHISHKTMHTLPLVKHQLHCTPGPPAQPYNPTPPPTPCPPPVAVGSGLKPKTLHTPTCGQWSRMSCANTTLSTCVAVMHTE